MTEVYKIKLNNYIYLIFNQDGTAIASILIQVIINEI